MQISCKSIQCTDYQANRRMDQGSVFQLGFCRTQVFRQWYPRVLRNSRCSVKKKTVSNICNKPQDALSRLLVSPKCISGRGYVPNTAGKAYSAPPDSLAGGRGSLPKNPSPLSAFRLDFRPFGPQESPTKNTWVP